MKKYKINMSDHLHHFANVVGQTFVDQLYSKKSSSDCMSRE